MAAMNINAKQYEELILGEKPVLVDFWAPWCSYCRRIGPALDKIVLRHISDLPYEKIAEQYGESMVVAKVNIDEEPQLAQAERIEMLPTLVLYRDGKAIDSIVAPESKAAIDRFIQEAMNK